MIDPFGQLVRELKADVALAALVGGRVRGDEPHGATINAAGVVTDEGDARAAGSYIRFVVLVSLATERAKDARPLQTVRIGFRCYGTTPTDAMAVYGALSGAIHRRGPRIGANGVLIYRSYDDVGGAAAKDPVTQQPYVDGVIELFAATVAVTP